MKALVLNCSPVRTGATARICEILKETLSAQASVDCACIDDFSIAYCRGCRSCHKTARCVMRDGAQELMARFEDADRIVCVSPSYWADVPGQFKAFIDRCTPWCNTHEPHASLSPGKRGYAAVLRTGPGMRECERLCETIEHFYGHLEIESGGRLALPQIEYRDQVEPHRGEIERFCGKILL